jgi:hypothetical protein
MMGEMGKSWHMTFSVGIRNPLLSPALMAALQWLRPGSGPRMIERLIRAGRIADAAALAEMLVIEADRP